MNPFYIIVHHSLTPDGSALDYDAIKKYHMSWAIDGVIVNAETWFKEKQKNPNRYFKRPWDDIGYHRIIEYVDGELTIKDGREVGSHGAHCYQDMRNRDGKKFSLNEIGIGYLVVGNFDIIEPNIETLEYLADYIVIDCLNYNIPVSNVLGHREVKGVTKSCPGNLFNIDMLRKIISEKLDNAKVAFNS